MSVFNPITLFRSNKNKKVGVTVHYILIDCCPLQRLVAVCCHDDPSLTDVPLIVSSCIFRPLSIPFPEGDVPGWFVPWTMCPWPKCPKPYINEGQKFNACPRYYDARSAPFCDATFIADCAWPHCAPFVSIVIIVYRMYIDQEPIVQGDIILGTANVIQGTDYTGSPAYMAWSTNAVQLP